MSKVSVWVGPPDIHNRMQLRRRVAAAAEATWPNQPEAGAARAPAAERASHWRLVIRGKGVMSRLEVLVVQQEFTRIQQRPEDVSQGLT